MKSSFALTKIELKLTEEFKPEGNKGIEAKAFPNLTCLIDGGEDIHARLPIM